MPDTDFYDAEVMAATAREQFRRYSGVRADRLGQNSFDG
jgi:hypothetical protein